MSLPSQQSDGGTYEYPAEVVHQRAAETRAMALENKRLRTALLTISTADDPDAPIDRATCAAVATAALTGKAQP